MKINLTHNQRGEIIRLHRGCQKRRFADKLKSILLLSQGLSCTEVGRILLLDDDTIRIYRRQYLNEGVDSLLSDNNKGGSCYLLDAQIDELGLHLEQNVYTDSKGIIAWIIEKFNVLYTPSGINDLLKRLGFVYKKPVLAPCKADIDKQEAFIEKYRELKENLGDKDQIYFVDGVHPQHNTIANYGWIKRGRTKHIKTNNGRKRTHINGAINLADKKVLYVEDEKINSQTMIVLLQIILKEQKEGKIYIVLDNASYYHAQVIKDFLKENSRIEFRFLPPYSPNLNIIERLWHILKKKVVYNKFYLKFKDFKTAVKQFFDDKVWLNEEFKNILTDNFQIIKPDFSGSYS